MTARPLKALSQALILLLLCAGCVAQTELGGAERPAARAVIELNEGWRFRFEPAPSPSPPPDAGATAWQDVRLPHSWNRLGEYRLDRSDRVNRDKGVGWYRLALDGARLPADKRHVLEFNGVGNIADLWVNGVHAGRHAGAFSRFRFDVTDLLRSDSANEILVRADNSAPALGSSTEHVIPLLGDFFIHGGIYRGVSLISVEPAHIDLLDHGGPGVYARTISIGSDSAKISVLTRLRNAGPAPRTLIVAAEIRDASGKIAARSNAPVRLAGSSVAENSLQLSVPSPRLWNGRADPYLYQLSVELRDGDRVIDRVVEPLGIRSFRIDPDKGFFLNGRRMPLHGVSRHQDWLGKGWAISREDHARDMALIAEMGANSVRFAHYQHAPAWFEEADRAGMVVWAELPFVNKPSFGDAPASPELIANARTQLIEMIRQNYNHPSVVTWGIGNEMDIDLAFGRLGPKADPRPLLRELHALARAEDPDRPTVIADCCEDTPGDKVDYLPVSAGIADLMGYNRYFGWYYGKADDLGAHLDALHAKHPKLPISVSEYGAGGAISQHSDNPEGGPINTSGRPHPEEFQSWWHERSWPQIAARPYLWGSWIWNMFDFSSDIRQEGDATDINDKGLVTFDRAVKKDGFFFYKAHWSSEPVVHITGRRYVDRAYPVTDIRIYSNAPEVAVTLNERALGTARCVERVCVLKDVQLSPGENRIAAQADFAGRKIGDSVRWNAPDASAGLSINVGELAGFVAKGGRRVGSDNWFDGGEPRRLDAKLTEKTAGEGDRRLHSGYREGRFGYAIPMPNGRWQVTLLFMEPDEKRSTPRHFDVLVNGERALRNFDPAKATGGPLKAVARTFQAEVSDGRLRLSFVPVAGDAVLSAIEISPPAS